MASQSFNRRDFLKTSTLAAAGATMPYWFSTSMSLAEQAARSPNERLTIGCIGTGDRWHQDPYSRMRLFGDVVSLCDVDAKHLERAQKRVLNDQREAKREPGVETTDDYRKVLDRKDLDVILIVTPDHWHSKLAIEAMQAGKDVYCEKPLTLTIHEGKQIIKVLEETKRVFQVGTQQRTEMNRGFLTALALIRAGRIGKVTKMTCDIGSYEDWGVIPTAPVPAELNWDRWLGQAPLVDFRLGSLPADSKNKWPPTRCHYEFRWWYEYSGGKMTDWGAHHVDIAQWAIEQNGPGQGPISVTPIISEHPVPFKDGIPQQDDRYNCASKFDVKVMFPGDVEMRIVSESADGNGILFEGTEGRFHVNRRRLKGAPVDDLEKNPLPEGALEKIYGGTIPATHQENFVECIKTRARPISDVWTHHKTMCTCHLANIALRLNAPLDWDAKREQITNNALGKSMQAREQRKGYEIDVKV
ncbi:Gfo/Idh/MocA family oxidoreductase [Planctomicrobium sp. SH664]|uniref:Gfo/Idh/MocA family oxidoreductase n=1 Tax=Planctomicrobium sp. SH664 TaxID=3448125 RepID=UPI003F5BA3D8